MTDPGLAERAIEEVRGLHAFFVTWFRGETAAAADFARCETAFAPDFRMVTPAGDVSDRASVIARLRAARGSAPGDFAIDVLEPRAVWQGADAVLLEYVERQYLGGGKVDRRSTGLFASEPAAPLGVTWRHLHETWIRSAEGSRGPPAEDRPDGRGR